MTPEDLKERNRRFVDDAWMRGNLAVVDELLEHWAVVDLLSVLHQISAPTAVSS